jgi:hypothetical protein
MPNIDRGGTAPFPRLGRFRFQLKYPWFEEDEPARRKAKD